MMFDGYDKVFESGLYLCPEILNDARIGLLSDHLFRRLIEIGIALRITDYKPTVASIAWKLHCEEAEIKGAIDKFIELGFAYYDKETDRFIFHPGCGAKDYFTDRSIKWYVIPEELPDDVEIIEKYYSKLLVQWDKQKHTIWFVEKIPTESGVYFFFDNTGELVYIGSSENLSKRIPSSFKERMPYKNIQSIAYITCDDVEEARKTESLLISEHQPVLNIRDVNSYKNTTSGIDIKYLEKETIQIWSNK